MTEKGINVTFNEGHAFIEKNGHKITLTKTDSLWALPKENKTLRIASLRMETGGKTNAETWHRRLGHIGDHKLQQMIKNGILPGEAGGYTAKKCEVYQLTHPKRRPVPRKAERQNDNCASRLCAYGA